MSNQRRGPSVSNSGRAAIGLIGLLVVTLIVLYLMFGNMGGTTYMDEVDKTRKQGQQVSIDMQSEQLLTCITQYQLTNDALPESMADLDVPENAFVDPWGLQVRFTCEKDPGTGRGVVHIVSAGPDGEFDTEDDLTTTRDLSL